MTTASRNRTRQAILDAAIETLAQNSAASLGEIATAAQVGRTTLHRYFAERSDLLAAVTAEGNERLSRATSLARLDDGPGAQALLRLCREYFDLGPVLSLVFGEAQVALGEACPDPHHHASIATVVARGHADGTIDPALPADWVENVFWSLMYAAWSHRGEESRHGVLDLLVRSLGNALRPAQ